MVCTRFSVHCLQWTWPLTFWLKSLIRSTSTNPNKPVAKIGRNSLHWFVRLYSAGFSGHCLLWPWPLTFWLQNPISIFTNANTIATKIGQNSLNWFLRYGVHRVFWMHRLAHSLTDGQTRLQNAFGTVFQRRYKIAFWAAFWRLQNLWRHAGPLAARSRGRASVRARRLAWWVTQQWEVRWELETTTWTTAATLGLTMLDMKLGQFPYRTLNA